MTTVNTKPAIINLLKKGDLRTTGKVDKVIRMAATQRDFDLLFEALSYPDRRVILRAADAIEKISLTHPEFLHKHKAEVIKWLPRAAHIELKWHLAQLVPRLSLGKAETREAWTRLYAWASDKNESRIVRVNSVQTLFELASACPEFRKSFTGLVSSMVLEGIPSITARLEKLKKETAW